MSEENQKAKEKQKLLLKKIEKQIKKKSEFLKSRGKRKILKYQKE